MSCRSRSRWLSVAGLVLGLVGASMATAGQAAASIPGLVPVSSTAAGFNAPAFAVATCPAGKFVYGLGGEVIGANGKVHMVSLLPDPGLTSVTVTAEPTVPFVAPWQVTAYAICGFPTALPQLEIMPAQSWQDTELCAAGTALYGTGAQHTGSPKQTLHEMAPDIATPPTMARASVSPAGGAVIVAAAAVCGNPLPTLKSIATVGIGSTAVCPHGLRVHGTGGRIPAANPDIVFEKIVPNPALTQVRVTARNRTTGLLEPSAAFAVCA